ncbi:MAG: DUF4968 domain-containing protein [Bacteroidetes bacterium]|nr:DUF4968 domain-containing protein [Bacteroidota bacterium]
MKRVVLLKYYLLMITLFASVLCMAQVNAEKIISYKKVIRGIEGKTTNAMFDVHVYNDNIIRVRVTKNKTFNTVNYPLENQATPSFYTDVKDNGNTIEISTVVITAIIEKTPSMQKTTLCFSEICERSHRAI